MVIPIVNGGLGTLQKRLERELKEVEIRGRMETILITELLGALSILTGVFEETYSNSDSSVIAPANARLKNEQGVK